MMIIGYIGIDSQLNFTFTVDLLFNWRFYIAQWNRHIVQIIC